jgi:chromosome segregation ATPase
VEQLRDDDRQRSGQAKALALQSARDAVKAEMADMATELDMLRSALTDHDELLREYRERLRVEQEARLAAETRGISESADPDVASLGKEIDAVTQRLQAADARANDLVIRLDVAETRAREADRLLSDVDTLTARLEATKKSAEVDLADAMARAVEFEGKFEAAETRSCDLQRANASLRREAGDATKARRAAEDALRDAAAERDDMIERLADAERQLDIARAAATPAAPVSVGADGVQEQPAPPTPELTRELAEARAEIEKLRAAAEKPAPAPDGMRRHAMAELRAIAGASASDDLVPRRR